MYSLVKGNFKQENAAHFDLRWIKILRIDQLNYSNCLSFLLELILRKKNYYINNQLNRREYLYTMILCLILVILQYSKHISFILKQYPQIQSTIRNKLTIITESVNRLNKRQNIELKLLKLQILTTNIYNNYQII
ncbi:hypothetical protein pb186bvf_006226 [Paramecium bursaria]